MCVWWTKVVRSRRLKAGTYYLHEAEIGKFSFSPFLQTAVWGQGSDWGQGGALQLKVQYPNKHAFVVSESFFLFFSHYFNSILQK